MNLLLKWWKAEPVVEPRKIHTREVVEVDPVTIESVEPAPVPNQDIEDETRRYLGKLSTALIDLGRTSYETRRDLGSSALASLNGGHH